MTWRNMKLVHDFQADPLRVVGPPVVIVALWLLALVIFPALAWMALVAAVGFAAFVVALALTFGS